MSLVPIKCTHLPVALVRLDEKEKCALCFREETITMCVSEVPGKSTGVSLKSHPNYISVIPRVRSASGIQPHPDTIRSMARALRAKYHVDLHF